MPEKKPAKNKSYFEEARTLTGYTLLNAAEMLSLDFPQKAIKKREGGGADLSSISTYYELERLNTVFGLCGLGWWYEIADLTSHEDTIVAEVHLRYCWYHPSADKEGISKPIPCKGQGVVRKGMSRGDAEKSAITDALTKAASLLGIGLSVFKGEQTHRTPAKPNPQQKADAQAPVQQPELPSDVIEGRGEFVQHNPHYAGKESDQTVRLPAKFVKAPKTGRSLIYEIFGEEIVFPKKHVVGHTDSEVIVTAWIANAKNESNELPTQASSILAAGLDQGDAYDPDEYPPPPPIADDDVSF